MMTLDELVPVTHEEFLESEATLHKFKEIEISVLGHAVPALTLVAIAGHACLGIREVALRSGRVCSESLRFMNSMADVLPEELKKVVHHNIRAILAGGQACVPVIHSAERRNKGHDLTSLTPSQN